MSRQVEAARQRLGELESRLAVRQQEKDGLSALVGRAGEIEAAYAGWQAARAGAGADGEDRRPVPRAGEAARSAAPGDPGGARPPGTGAERPARQRQAEIDSARAEAQSLQTQTEAERTEMAVAEARLERRARLDDQLQAARQRQAEARAENPRLKARWTS